MKADFESMLLHIPDGGRLRLTFGPGDVLLAVAVLCDFGEVEVRAHAAPRGARADLGGQWRAMLTELAGELHAAGLRLAAQDGPLGREIGASDGRTYRGLIGRDAERCTLVAVSAGPARHADQLVGFAREVLAGTEPRRGDEPQPAKALLPLRIVDPSALGEWERADLGPHEPRGVPQEPFRPRFPSLDEPGARGSAMQQLRGLRP